MLLLWHEALGSDDEQAAEDELCARVLYSHEEGGGHGEERLLQRLHLVQGLLTFVRMLRRSGGLQAEENDEVKTSAQWTPEWASVTLSRRRFFVLEVEPQIFMALGVRATVEIKDHGPGYAALLREMYGMFRLFHGSIDSNLRLLPPAPVRQSGAGDDGSGKSTDKSEIPLEIGQYKDGMDLLMDIAAVRKRLRKLRLTLDSHFHNHSCGVSDEGGKEDNTVIKHLQEEVRAVGAKLEVLLDRSPAAILQKRCGDFFPTLLQTLDVRAGAASKDLHAITLERLENFLDGQQRFQSLAELVFTRYNATFAPEKNVPNIHPLPPFLYINRINLAFRMQHVPRLLKSKEGDLFPVPVKMLAHYFPASTMAIVNELHAELHRCSSAGNREICVRTRHAGWVLAKKSETSHREMYVFFDSKISSVYELSDSLQMLLHDQFGNVLF
ncbi:hypothetical protein PF006_g9507 [Phytophthora fragariae]|uniref:CCZ1/INTU/HPS4 third Longin domain-containing protein n=1 Tax=Phytophthora fragariae TaxID=53985 RepID=A0A6A3KAR0_9STRA|nr:hypothetical protein PF011_g12426 [Phytophthora fragariae]KAE9145652.1 hypothetical protein PF006_g9507 [Phytophthora fragariae]